MVTFKHGLYVCTVFSMVTKFSNRHKVFGSKYLINNHHFYGMRIFVTQMNNSDHEGFCFPRKNIDQPYNTFTIP